MADDTGLEVDALGGRPGVRSARYAGPDGDAAANIDKLLAELDERGATSAADRAARFRTVALLRRPDGSELVAHGEVEGHIATAQAGTNGFGYDPVFVPVEAETGRPGARTFAEMSAEDKHATSHRGRAFRALAAQLHRAAGQP